MPIVYPKVDDLRNRTLSPSWWRADLPWLTPLLRKAAIYGVAIVLLWGSGYSRPA
jgi:hypothetical protein